MRCPAEPSMSSFYWFFSQHSIYLKSLLIFYKVYKLCNTMCTVNNQSELFATKETDTTRYNKWSQLFFDVFLISSTLLTLLFDIVCCTQNETILRFPQQNIALRLNSCLLNASFFLWKSFTCTARCN